MIKNITNSEFKLQFFLSLIVYFRILIEINNAAQHEKIQFRKYCYKSYNNLYKERTDRWVSKPSPQSTPNDIFIFYEMVINVWALEILHKNEITQ